MFSPEFLASSFEKVQIAILAVLGVTVFLYWMNKGSNSHFRKREADRSDLDRLLKGNDLADARIRKRAPPPPPLALPGLRLNGEPHEILGIPENASESEIMKAYKDAIKRFHPDTLQGSAKDQMRFYQEASAKINDAKNQMLKKLRS